MEPSYILQIHSGSFQNAHTDFRQIKNKVENILAKKKIKAVIFGWHLNQSLNQSFSQQEHCLLFLVTCIIRNRFNKRKQDNNKLYRAKRTKCSSH